MIAVLDERDAETRGGHVVNAGGTPASFDLDDAEAALSGLRDVLIADGYDVSLSISGPETLGLDVIAGPGACAECLVPKDLMTAIVMDALAGTIPVSRVEIRYQLPPTTG